MFNSSISDFIDLHNQFEIHLDDLEMMRAFFLCVIWVKYPFNSGRNDENVMTSPTSTRHCYVELSCYTGLVCSAEGK
jgi:hypothetical protein